MAAKARQEAAAKLAAEQAARKKAQDELDALRAELEELKAKTKPPSNELLTPTDYLNVRNTLIHGVDLTAGSGMVQQVAKPSPLDFGPPLAEQLPTGVDTEYPTGAPKTTDRQLLMALAQAIRGNLGDCEPALETDNARTLLKKLAKSVSLFEAAVNAIPE